MKHSCAIFFTLSFSIFFFTLSAQDNATLTPILEDIKTKIGEVQGKSDTYDQEFSWDETTPYKVNFTITTTNKKGKTEEMRYAFNLRDIDKNTIKVKNDKDLMKLSLFMDNRQKLIKVFKEGKQEKYSDQVQIVATDVDNARVIEDLLEEGVAVAAKIKPPGLPESFDERMTWLSEHVVNVDIDETAYAQNLEQDEDLPVVVRYALSKDKKGKSSETAWKVNLADLKERTVQLKIKGKSVFVAMETTRKLKFIEANKEGKRDGFTNKMEIMVDDPDKGKMLVDILQGMIGQSQEMEKNRFAPIADLSSGLNNMAEQVGDFEVKEDKYTQSINPECITTLAFTETDSKDKTTEKKYLFNLADLNDNKVDIKVKGQLIAVEMETMRSKLIQSFKDGEMQNYTNKVSLLAKDVENAKWLLHHLPANIKFCQENKNNESLAIKGAAFDWVQQNVVDMSERQQALSKVEDAECKWQLTTIKKGKKSDTEETYEFNLSDLDPKAIDFKISGKKLGVEVYTKYKEKNIKYYKNGEPGDYKNNFLIDMDNVEKTREMIKTLKAEVEGCKS